MATRKTPPKKSPLVQSISISKNPGSKKTDDSDYPKELFNILIDDAGSDVQTGEPDPTFMARLEKDISDIFGQAHSHRQLLIKFFAWYTSILSSFVLLIVFIQVFARIYLVDNPTIEVVPQWVLYLLVIGMFGQFIGLLTIVTKKVWTFEPFFQHFLSVHGPTASDPDSTTDQSPHDSDRN